MSAWYIFSSLGFYPVTPGSPYYALGSPLVEEATIDLGNGKTLKIIVKNQSPENVFVKELSINGEEIQGFLISHDEIMAGGEMVFEMSSECGGPPFGSVHNDNGIE